jgi:hypothetical protein
MEGEERGVTVALLTWHGTVVRVDRDSGALIHARLWPVRDIASDWFVSLADGDIAGVAVRSVRNSRLVTLQRGADFLCAERDTGAVVYNRRAAGEWERFLPVSAAELAALRAVLGHEWREEGGSGVFVPWFGEGMRLDIGGQGAGLMAEFPAMDGETIRLAPEASVLVRGAALAAPADIEVSRRAAALQAPAVGDAAAFAAAAEGRLVLRGAAEFGFLPLAISRAHEDWMDARWSQPGPRLLGRQVNACAVVRERDKFVLLAREREGLVFDANGASNDAARLMGLSINERGALTREGGHIFARGAALEQAPYLAGPHAVFHGGDISNYHDWVIRGVLALRIMAPFLPAGTALLLPGGLPPRVDYRGSLEAWGLGDFPVAEIAAPVCRVDEVFWLDNGRIEQIPAELVRRVRADILARLGPGDARRHIYIRRARTRRVVNAAAIELLARNHGFSVHELDGMTPRAQMELFRDAEFVVAPHGAELANLVCCAAGTRVLELSPESEFRPVFAQLSGKLDLAHAVLPCPVSEGGFSGDMMVDAGAFRMLVRQLRARQAA